MNREIMTLRELSDYLQVAPSKLYRLVQQGDIPGTKIGRTWRFRKDLVDEWFVQVGRGTQQAKLMK